MGDMHRTDTRPADRDPRTREQRRSLIGQESET